MSLCVYCGRMRDEHERAKEAAQRERRARVEPAAAVICAALIARGHDKHDAAREAVNVAMGLMGEVDRRFGDE